MLLPSIRRRSPLNRENSIKNILKMGLLFLQKALIFAPC
jgi:hypothetical protein